MKLEEFKQKDALLIDRKIICNIFIQHIKRGWDKPILAVIDMLQQTRCPWLVVKADRKGR